MADLAQQTADDEWVSLREIEPGIFETKDGALGFKSEYQTMNQKNGIYQVDAYVLSSGEYWWGGHNSVRERDAELVKPVSIWKLMGRKEPGE